MQLNTVIVTGLLRVKFSVVQISQANRRKFALFCRCGSSMIIFNNEQKIEKNKKEKETITFSLHGSLN